MEFLAWVYRFSEATDSECGNPIVEVDVEARDAFRPEAEAEEGVLFGSPGSSQSITQGKGVAALHEAGGEVEIIGAVEQVTRLVEQGKNVLAAVTDQGSNMVKGWNSEGHIFCAAHNAHNSVKHLCAQELFKPVVRKAKGIANSVRNSLNTLNEFREAQRVTRSSDPKLPQECGSTRWTTIYTLMCWIIGNEVAIRAWLGYSSRGSRTLAEHRSLHESMALTHEEWIMLPVLRTLIQPLATFIMFIHTFMHTFVGLCVHACAGAQENADIPGGDGGIGGIDGTTR
eukprot:GHVU01198644.1.p1 GENE.GHVU01198644.1~~GHVU01198644.1.p1  ORF type:complete len:285 (-),score=25.90 GHVU01198644.1:571-1425(-)